jgi:uncharacterized protein
MRFHAGELEVQQHAGVRTNAEEVGDGIVDFVSEKARDFLQHRQFVILGTIDSRCRPWASVIIGEPGFISVPDPHTVRLESLAPAGDPLLENLASESHAAMLAIDFLNPRRLRINGKGAIQRGAIYIKTEQVYGNCRRYIQERRFAGHRRTDRLDDGALVRSPVLSTAQRDQIRRTDTFFIASDHLSQGADVSHKGGAPGFVRIIDQHRLSFPDYNGNSMFNTLGNITLNPRAGLLFIDFGSGRTLQLTGVASIDWDPARVREIVGAERIIDFETEEVIDRSSGFSLVSNFHQFSRFNP